MIGTRRLRVVAGAAFLGGLLLLGTAHASLIDLLLPGSGSRHVEDLDPSLRVKVERVLLDLEQRGFQPQVISTFRSAARQDFIYRMGLFIERYGGARITRAQGGESCHNAVGEFGAPAALAVDIIDGDTTHDVEQRVRFYRALGKAARKQGLIWGGDWKRRNLVWKKHGIGWDPVHLQSQRCRQWLQKARHTPGH